MSFSVHLGWPTLGAIYLNAHSDLMQALSAQRKISAYCLQGAARDTTMNVQTASYIFRTNDEEAEQPMWSDPTQVDIVDLVVSFP